LKFLLSISLAIFITTSLIAQPCNLKLTGHVEDADTKDKLIAASVFILEKKLQIITDSKADFVFNNLCAGNYTIQITHVGCDTVIRKITLAKDYHIDILLPHQRGELGIITVESQRGIANTGFKKELSGNALEQTRGLSLAEALSKINGVTMLQSGSTIAKPVIHGLHSNRILTINNGVRQEGQQWGNEHAPEIDPFIADKLTIIKGVDELKYGSDAIGGVILVEPKALRNTTGYAAEINSAYFTNNKQYVASALFEQQLKKIPAFKYRIQGTYKRGANATTANYRLNNTASEEKNFSATVGWKKSTFNTELFYSHFETEIGIFRGSHIGNLTDLKNAIAELKPNDKYLGENTYTIVRPRQDVVHDLIKSKTTFYLKEHKFSLLIAGQFNKRKEFDIVISSTNTKPQLNLNIQTFTQDISWEHPKKNNFTGVAGVALMQQNNDNLGRYLIPNYTSYSIGGYYIEKWSKHDWDVQAGIRYDNKTINTIRLKSNNDTTIYGFNFSTLASSINAAYKINDNWKANVNVSLASRAPYVNELLSDGIHHGTATYEKGDINLKPEQALHFTTGASFQNKQKTFFIDALLYVNSINNFIYQQPFPDSPVLTIAGAFPLLKYTQVNAVLSGIDLSSNVKITKSLELSSKFSYLHARNKTTNDWLILMPANRFNNELIYNFKDGKKLTKSYLSIEMANVLQQKNVPSDKLGKQDYKDAPNGYNLIHANISTTYTLYKTPITISVGVRNIFNIAYRDYLNGMRYFTDEMGRNISMRLKIIL
jgi:iron complex outermembrane recepter protein